jgi:hypothetical protein
MAMTKAEMRKELENLRHDKLWIMKEKYKALWIRADNKLASLGCEIRKFQRLDYNESLNAVTYKEEGK